VNNDGSVAGTMILMKVVVRERRSTLATFQ
jgi:hypothetical protein